MNDNDTSKNESDNELDLDGLFYEDEWDEENLEWTTSETAILEVGNYLITLEDKYDAYFNQSELQVRVSRKDYQPFECHNNSWFSTGVLCKPIRDSNVEFQKVEPVEVRQQIPDGFWVVFCSVDEYDWLKISARLVDNDNCEIYGRLEKLGGRTHEITIIEKED